MLSKDKLYNRGLYTLMQPLTVTSPFKCRVELFFIEKLITMEFNQFIKIDLKDILGFGIRIDGIPVAVGINPTNNKAFTVKLNFEHYRSLKASVLETEPDNFIEKDQFYNTSNGYTEVYLRTKHQNNGTN